jgi:O-antigen ligase
LVVAFSVYNFSGFQWNPVTIKGIFRPFYKDHTIFGASSALLSAFWLFFATKTNYSKLKILFVFLGIIFLGCVILSFSRAAFLSFVFFGFVWIALQIHIRAKHIVVLALMGIFLIGLYQDKLTLFINSNQNISHDSNSTYLERIESSANITTDISNLERLNRWYSGLKMAKEKPLTGFGPGTYQFIYIPYQNPKLMNRLTVKSHWHIPENSGGTAHSEYVLALSEMGIFGLVSVLLLFGRWFWIALEKAYTHPQRKNILIAFAVLSSYLFHGAFNNFLNTDKFAFLFWGFAAWMVANYELKSNT